MKNFLLKIYAYKFFEDFVLIYPLYAVLFTDSGMEPWEVGVLLTSWSVTTFVLEIPSGVWADKYSRKQILFLGQFVRAIGYLIWLVYPNFWGFLIGFIFWGVESALSSGTFEALVYDQLKAFGEEGNYGKVIGRTRTASAMAILLGSLLASPAILVGYPFILLLSSGAVLISAGLALSLPKAKMIESTHENAYFSLLRQGIAGALQDGKVFRLIIFLALVTALPGALDEYYTIFGDQAGLPKFGLGIFIALLSGAEAIAGLIVPYFEKRSDRFFQGLFFFNGLVLCLAAYLFSIAALWLLIFFSFSFTLIQVVFSARLQHRIDAETRATVSSISGFLTEIAVMLIFFGVGWIAQGSDYRESFIVMGVLTSVIGLFYVIIRKLL
ncbi:MAG: MFS transporter [Saprospiraceae bacterium]|nr:MFS transporter [Saprospiraceae bacterium]